MLTGSEAESASSDVDAPSSRESGREAKTWSFSVLVRLEDGQTFSNLLDMRKKQLETSLASASVISSILFFRLGWLEENQRGPPPSTLDRLRAGIGAD